MSDVTQQLADALRAIYAYCVKPVPEDPCHADLDTIGDIALAALRACGEQ